MSSVEIIKSQYLASLEMLREAVMLCPENQWDNSAYKNKFWQVVYHALFYVHFYLQPGVQAFVPWAKDRKGVHQMEPVSEPYLKQEILEYFEICQKEVQKQMPSLDLDAPSGFDWLPFTKMELQIYSIRHLQHHTGELCERLGGLGEIEVHWVGSKRE
jgi:hypothetical protein